jgi:hypothetical protein
MDVRPTTAKLTFGSIVSASINGISKNCPTRSILCFAGIGMRINTSDLAKNNLWNRRSTRLHFSSRLCKASSQYIGDLAINNLWNRRSTRLLAFLSRLYRVTLSMTLPWLTLGQNIRNKSLPHSSRHRQSFLMS